MDTNTTTDTTETVTIAEFFSDEMTMYGMRTSVNKILASLGVDKTLPGPMFYTYGKKGYIKTIEGSEGKRTTKEYAIEWTEAYITKLTKVTVKEDTEDEEMTEPLFDIES